MKKPAKLKFAPISPADLDSKIRAKWNECDDSAVMFVESFGPDIKVEFDLENFDDGRRDEHWEDELPDLYGDNEINSFRFRGMTAGGNWEHPVFFIVYWDGKKLRAYVPSDGNPWNKRTKKAIGNAEGDEDDEDDDPGNFSFQPKEILADIRERFDLLVAIGDLPFSPKQRLATMLRLAEKLVAELKLALEAS